MAEDPTKKSYIFGRQKCKKLSMRQQKLVAHKLPDLLLEPKADKQPDDIWPAAKPLWLEIGFGGGEHLSAVAARNPEIGFIGCEPFLNGIAKLLVAIEDQQLNNIHIYNNDARHILSWLPEARLDRVYLLYPDPWPKKRHHKRRFVTNETLAMLARVMKPGADLLIASDIGDYIRTSLLALAKTDQFSWQPQSAAEWKTPPEGWPGTRYEQKAKREGRQPTYLNIKRL